MVKVLNLVYVFKIFKFNFRLTVPFFTSKVYAKKSIPKFEILKKNIIIKRLLVRIIYHMKLCVVSFIKPVETKYVLFITVVGKLRPKG